MSVYTLFRTNSTVEVLEISREDQKSNRIVEYLRQFIVDRWLEINVRFRIGKQACTIFMADDAEGRNTNFLVNQALINSATKTNYNRKYLDQWGTISLRGDIVIKTTKPIDPKFLNVPEAMFPDTASDESE